MGNQHSQKGKTQCTSEFLQSHLFEKTSQTQTFKSKSPLFSSPKSQKNFPIRVFQKPTNEIKTTTIEQKTTKKQEIGELQNSEKIPPLKNRSCHEITHSLSDFLSFRKVISQNEEDSLLIETSFFKTRIIDDAMSEFETKTSFGQGFMKEDDDDFISMDDFQNILPFEFSESNQELNSSASCCKLTCKNTFF